MDIDLGLFVISFANADQWSSSTHQANYSWPLVALSYVFALAGSLVGLRGAEQSAFSANRGERQVWLLAGALAMGAGVWSMHFIGMMAYQMPHAATYDVTLTAVSAVPSVLASYLGLTLLSQHKMKLIHLVAGSVLMGAGIGAMHYIGMAAMMSGMKMVYDPWFFALSIVVAVALAFVALTAKARLTKWMHHLPNYAVNLVSAATMGLAISGMHYTAMLAVRFQDSPIEHQGEGGVDYAFFLIAANIFVFLLTFLLLAAYVARKSYDNSLLKHATERLAQSEDRWNFALEGAGQGVWDRDYITGEKYHAPMWYRIRGRSPDEVMDDTLSDWEARIHPDDLELVKSTIARRDAGEMDKDGFEYRERHADGRWIWILSRGKPIAWDENGKPTRIIGTDTDITERKELELQLADKLNYLDTTIQNYPGGIALYDKELRLTVANESFYELNLMDPDKFPLGTTTLEEVIRDHAKLGAYGDGDIDQIVAERLADNRTLSRKQWILHRENDGRSIEYSRSPLKGGGFVLTITDITEKLAAEAERAALERELSQAQKMESLGTLASGVAHEINTPIQYIGDNIRFMQDSLEDVVGLLDEYRTAAIDAGTTQESSLKQKEEQIDLEFIREELPQSIAQSLEGVAQVARIVKAIKEFSHPGRDEMEPVDLNAAIDTTLTVSRNQWKYVSEVSTDFADDLPKVDCYQGDINQVILNMVVNAAQAIEESGKSEPGKIDVSTRLEDGFAVIRIKDNGMGMSEAVRRKIFDPFFTTKEVGKGTGQGLAISYSIIHQKHRGTIEVSSEPDVGTCFTIKIPVSARQAEESAA